VGFVGQQWHNSKVAEGLISAAGIELEKIRAAGGPEKDPDFEHHKTEIEAMLDRAKNIAERLPRRAKEKLLKKIDEIERLVAQ
jgi:hypothetical protein